MQNEPKTLLALSLEAIRLESQLIETDGELTPELESELSLNTNKLPEKLDAYAGILQRLDITQEHFESQIEMLKAAIKRIERSRDHLNSNLMQSLKLQNKTKLEGNVMVFELKESRGKVNVTDINLLDPEFKRSKLTYEPDKVKLAEALKNGACIPGAEIVKTESIKLKLKT